MSRSACWWSRRTTRRRVWSRSWRTCRTAGRLCLSTPSASATTCLTSSSRRATTARCCMAARRRTSASPASRASATTRTTSSSRPTSRGVASTCPTSTSSSTTTCRRRLSPTRIASAAQAAPARRAPPSRSSPCMTQRSFTTLTNCSPSPRQMSHRSLRATRPPSRSRAPWMARSGTLCSTPRSEGVRAMTEQSVHVQCGSLPAGALDSKKRDAAQHAKI
mmetsp:Transcript_24624/g.72939  ORF Transcript_24624/g.72939 Transcript_24624/m.72939 type:complete len:220 (+) Transcript_24624:414-1073(+)